MWKESWLKQVQTVTMSLTPARDVINHCESKMWWTLNYKSFNRLKSHLNQYRSIENHRFFKCPPSSQASFANKLEINWKTYVPQVQYETLEQQFEKMFYFIFTIALRKNSFNFANALKGHYYYIGVRLIQGLI